MSCCVSSQSGAFGEHYRQHGHDDPVRPVLHVRPVAALFRPLHPGILRLLVQAHLQGLQVGIPLFRAEPLTPNRILMPRTEPQKLTSMHSPSHVGSEGS